MYDIELMKKSLIQNPADKESLEYLRTEARRKEDKDLKVFTLIFEPEGFKEIRELLYDLGSKIMDYFSPEEWELIYKNNPIIPIRDRVDLLYGNEINLEAINPRQLEDITRSLQETPSLCENIKGLEIPILKDSIFKLREMNLDKFINLEYLSVGHLDNFTDWFSLSVPLNNIKELVQSQMFYNCPFVYLGETRNLESFTSRNLGDQTLAFLAEYENLKEVLIFNPFGVIPLNFEAIRNKRLKKLALCNFGLLDTLEDFDLSGLEEINIRGNRFRGLEGCFPSLKILEMSRNPWEDFSFLDHCPSLEKIFVDNKVRYDQDFKTRIQGRDIEVKVQM